MYKESMDIDDILQAYSRAVMHDLRKSTTTSTGELEGWPARAASTIG